MLRLPRSLEKLEHFADIVVLDIERHLVALAADDRPRTAREAPVRASGPAGAAQAIRRRLHPRQAQAIGSVGTADRGGGAAARAGGAWLPKTFDKLIERSRARLALGFHRRGRDELLRIAGNGSAAMGTVLAIIARTGTGAGRAGPADGGTAWSAAMTEGMTRGAQTPRRLMNHVGGRGGLPVRSRREPRPAPRRGRRTCQAVRSFETWSVFRD